MSQSKTNPTKADNDVIQASRRLEYLNEQGQLYPTTDLSSIERHILYRRTYDNFPSFIRYIFSSAFEDFVRGNWIIARAEYLEANDKTAYVGPRTHFKSTGFYAYFLWKLWRARFNAAPGAGWAQGRKGFEAHYFSYKERSAAYHIGIAKDSICSLVARNPWFQAGGISDLKPTAESIGKWSWDGTNEISIHPHGMLSHTRGLHCSLTFVDDPFQDPENELNPTVVLKINYIFKSNVYEIPTRDGDELHIATTPQTKDDFTFDAGLMESFNQWITPAILDHSEQRVLWPEWSDYGELMAKKRELGPKLFNQEFMASPKSSEISFFSPDLLGTLEYPALRDGLDHTGGRFASFEGARQGVPALRRQAPELWRYLDRSTAIVGGLDIGKKTHPAHLAIFALRPAPSLEAPDPDVNPDPDPIDPAGHLVQIHSKWFDGVDYSEQVEYCKKAIRHFGVDSLPYDNTRGEYESLDELGRVPAEMTPVSISSGTKQTMGSYLDTFSADGRLTLLPDDRQRRQLLAVTNDLKAVETSEGHGESFTSIGLAARESQQMSFGSKFDLLE